MRVTPSIPKLAASPVMPFKNTPRFKNELLQPSDKPNWIQDVNYMRDIYSEIAAAWEEMSEPEQDRELYQFTEPRLRELMLGMKDVAHQLSSRRDIFRDSENAGHDFDIATLHAQGGNFAMANLYCSYSLTKLHRLLDGLTREVNKRGSRKLGYGYDVSGEVHESGGTSGNDRHLWDTGNSPKNNHTQNNPANMMLDADAESDYPELAQFKHKHVYWPPRTR